MSIVTVAIIAVAAVCAQADTQKWATELPELILHTLNGNQYATTDKYLFTIANTSLYAVDLATGSIAWSRDVHAYGYGYFPTVYASEKVVVFCAHYDPIMLNGTTFASNNTLMLLDPSTGNVNAEVPVRSMNENYVFFAKYIFFVGAEGYAAYNYVGEQAFFHKGGSSINIYCASVVGNEILMMVQHNHGLNEMWLINEADFQKRTISGVSLTSISKFKKLYLGLPELNICTPTKDGYLIVRAEPSTSSSSSPGSSSSSSPGSSSSSSWSSGGGLFALVDVGTGKYLWQKDIELPYHVWLFDDVVYTTTKFGDGPPGPLNAYDLKYGRLISTTTISGNVQSYGTTAFKFDEKIIFSISMDVRIRPDLKDSMHSILTVVDPATGQILNSTFVPSLPYHSFSELPDSFIVPNIQGLTRLDKATLQPVYRTLDMSDMVGVVPMPDGYLAFYDFYGSKIAYFEV